MEIGNREGGQLRKLCSAVLPSLKKLTPVVLCTCKYDASQLGLPENSGSSHCQLSLGVGSMRFMGQEKPSLHRSEALHGLCVLGRALKYPRNRQQLSRKQDLWDTTGTSELVEPLAPSNSSLLVAFSPFPSSPPQLSSILSHSCHQCRTLQNIFWENRTQVSIFFKAS